jgi:hypothetical protein
LDQFPACRREELRKILGKHPNFRVLLWVLERMDYLFTELSEGTTTEVEAMINGKPQVSPREEKSAQLPSKDVLHGFSLPVWRLFPTECYGPTRGSSHILLQEDGSRLLKRR